MGRPLPGYPIALLDPLTGEPADEGEICLDLLDRRPLGLMTGYPDDDRAERRGDARRLLPHRRRRRARRRRLHHLRRPHRRRLQGLRLPDLAVRARERADRARGGRRGGRRAVPGPAAAGGAEGVRRRWPPGYEPTRETAAGDPALRPRAPRAVQAHPPARVRRAAEDDLAARSAASSCARRSERRRPAAPPSSARRTSPTSSGHDRAAAQAHSHAVRVGAPLRRPAPPGGAEAAVTTAPAPQGAAAADDAPRRDRARRRPASPGARDRDGRSRAGRPPRAPAGRVRLLRGREPSSCSRDSCSRPGT